MTEHPRYEAVRVHPDGASTAARCALTAAEYGFDGIVLRNHGSEAGAVDAAEVGQQYDVDVVSGVEIVADDPSRASGYLGTHRPANTLVAVHGGTDAMNRFAVEQAAVDVLAHPTRGEGEPDEVLARTAKENDVRLEVCLAPLVDDPGGSRVRSITGLQQLWSVIDHYDAPYVVTAGAEAHLGLRAPRDLAALGSPLGLDKPDIERGLAEWGRIATENRRRADDAVVEPGVWREE